MSEPGLGNVNVLDGAGVFLVTAAAATSWTFVGTGMVLLGAVLIGMGGLGVCLLALKRWHTTPQYARLWCLWKASVVAVAGSCILNNMLVGRSVGAPGWQVWVWLVLSDWDWVWSSGGTSVDHREGVVHIVWETQKVFGDMGVAIMWGGIVSCFWWKRIGVAFVGVYWALSWLWAGGVVRRLMEAGDVHKFGYPSKMAVLANDWVRVGLAVFAVVIVWLMGGSGRKRSRAVPKVVHRVKLGRGG